MLKWDPTNAKDNSQSGYTGNVYLDAYRLDGTRLWRIDLGRNIRAGAHYTQFQVFDYDGDGRAEVAMKTADGTRSGTGQVIGSASADHRNSSATSWPGPSSCPCSAAPTAPCSPPSTTCRHAAPSPRGATTTATGWTGSWPARPMWTVHGRASSWRAATTPAA